MVLKSEVPGCVQDRMAVPSPGEFRTPGENPEAKLKRVERTIIRQSAIGFGFFTAASGVAFTMLPTPNETVNGPCAKSQIAIFRALGSYAADNDEFYPPYDLFPTYARADEAQQARRWRACLTPYVDSDKSFFCPSDPYKGKKVSVGANREDHRDTSFTYIAVSHFAMNKPDQPLRFRASNVPVPNKTMLLQDPLWVDSRDSSRITMSHGKTNNVLLFDGSIRALTANPYYCGWPGEENCIPL